MPARHQRKMFASPHDRPSEHNLHTTSRQTLMPEIHQHEIFASPHGTAAPNTTYKQPQPNPHASKTSTQNFAYLHGTAALTHFTYSKRPHANKTRHQHKIFEPWHDTFFLFQCQLVHMTWSFGFSWLHAVERYLYKVPLIWANPFLQVKPVKKNHGKDHSLESKNKKHGGSPPGAQAPLARCPETRDQKRTTPEQGVIL